MTRRARRTAALLTLAALAGAAGCGSGRYPVTGRVTYDDGSPLPEGSVVGECRDGPDPVMARGNVGPDGRFEWGTERAGDGAKPGKYKVIVVPRTLSNAELAQGMVSAVDGKFTRYDSSGIEFEVKDARNELNITVTRPKPGAKPK
ncbi:MAG: hypothetical protein C0501_18265 [Isosphaera sp.]|nr:hypothetical protein [Isosphaera sp.]